MVPVPRDVEEEQRPTTLLLVYTWDLVRAILVFFIAFAAFGGGTDIAGRTVALSTAVQIVLALADAAFGAVLLLLGMVLTKHAAWIRRAQITVLAMAVGIGLVSFAVVQARGGFELPALLFTLLLALIDVVALFAMTSRRIVAWYHEPGPVPVYIGGLIAFWAAVSAASIVISGLS